MQNLNTGVYTKYSIDSPDCPDASESARIMLMLVKHPDCPGVKEAARIMSMPDTLR